jgi:hypothetical protein
MLLAAAVGSGQETPSGGATSPSPTGWNAAALQTAEGLAGRLRAAGIRCEDYTVAPLAMFDADYQRRMPLAAAIASCTSDGDEDLTFEVFEDAAHARAFVDAKQAYLCKRAVDLQLGDFPGFVYIDGGTWIVEPDEKATADKLAPMLGGQAKVASCKK